MTIPVFSKKLFSAIKFTSIGVKRDIYLYLIYQKSQENTYKKTKKKQQ